MIRRLGFSAAVLGMLAVILGAFGAHWLESRIDPLRLGLIQTSILFLFVHSVAALCCALAAGIRYSQWLVIAGHSFVFGSVLFSGSLYLLAIRELIPGVPITIIAPVTPIGGLLFVLGWLGMIIHFIQWPKRETHEHL